MYNIFKKESWINEKITRVGYVDRFTGKVIQLLIQRYEEFGTAIFLTKRFTISKKYENFNFQVMVLVASETGHVYTFSTPKFKPILNSQQGRKLIRTCLSDETRNDDEDDINIDEVKVDQLEEINQSDENADYGDNDENDVRYVLNFF